jgi:hypothetical protein
VFNLGGGEIILLVLLAVIFFGPDKLPGLGELMRDVAWRSPRDPRAGRPWNRSEWLLVGAVLSLGLLAMAHAASR